MRRRLARRPRVKSVAFSDFDWYDPRTGVSVKVHGKEVQSLFKALAKCNGVPVASLLQNSKIAAGMPLKCYEVNQLPQEWSWQLDSAGYHLVKLKNSFVPRGHGCTGDGDDDSDYEQPKSHKKRGASASNFKPSTPQQARRAHRSRVCSRMGAEASLDSPEDGRVGYTQPVQIRLHRLAFLACCADPKAASKLQVRHICGNKKCAVLSHFRAGDFAANKADGDKHKSNPGCSRESFGPLQP